MRVYEEYAETISGLGYREVFTIPGTHIYHINHALSGKVLNIVFRHEMGTTMAADAYGRIVGKPGIAIDTAGPGLLNGLSGLGQAFSEASPLIYITGETSRDEYFGFHGVDIPLETSKSSKSVTKTNYVDEGIYTPSSILYKAFKASITGRRGPIHISIPYDVLTGEAGEEKLKSGEYEYEEIPKEILSLFESRIRGRKVLLIFGPEIYPELGLRYLEYIGNLPLLTTTSILGVLPQNISNFVGFIEKNFQIYPPAKNIVKEAEHVIAFGLDHRSPEFNLIKRINRSVTIDTVQYSSRYRLDITSDLSDDFKTYYAKGLYGYRFYGDILKYLEVISSHEGKWGERSYREIVLNRYKEMRELVLKEKSRYIHQGRLAIHLSQLIPENYIVTCDTGGNEQWIREFVGPYLKVRYLYSGGFGSIGYSLPAAIGAYFGYRENGRYRGVISIVGDGSLLMSISELNTVSLYNIPIKIVVFNDGKYGILEMLSIRDLSRRLESDLGTVDFSKIADGMGLESYLVESIEEFNDIFKYSLKVEKPVLIDVRCSGEEMPTLLRK